MIAVAKNPWPRHKFGLDPENDQPLCGSMVPEKIQPWALNNLCVFFLSQPTSASLRQPDLGFA